MASQSKTDNDRRNALEFPESSLQEKLIFFSPKNKRTNKNRGVLLVFTCLIASAWNWLRMISSFMSYASSVPWLWRDVACWWRDDCPRFGSVACIPSVYGMLPCAVACVGDFGLTKHASSDSSAMVFQFDAVHQMNPQNWKIDTRLTNWLLNLQCLKSQCTFVIFYLRITTADFNHATHRHLTHFQWFIWFRHSQNAYEQKMKSLQHCGNSSQTLRNTKLAHEILNSLFECKLHRRHAIPGAVANACTGTTADNRIQRNTRDNLIQFKFDLVCTKCVHDTQNLYKKKLFFQIDLLLLLVHLKLCTINDISTTWTRTCAMRVALSLQWQYKKHSFKYFSEENNLIYFWNLKWHFI